MMSFAVPRGWRPTILASQVKKLKGGEGYAPWEFGDIDYFKMRARRTFGMRPSSRSIPGSGWAMF